MDAATRYPIRERAGSYRDMDGQAMPEDSGGESESNVVRRKFQRTTTDPEATSNQGFRKPSVPASAMRGNPERAPSLNQRRKSTLRDNIRVPSGPREYPTSPGKQRLPSSGPIAPSASENAVPTSRSFLPALNTDSYLTNSRLASSHQRQGSYGNRRAGFPNSSTENLTDQQPIPTTPSQRTPLGDGLDFLPDVNFDDFQTSIKNYDGSSPLLNEFPSVNGGRILPREEQAGGARGGQAKEQNQSARPDIARTQSLRQRLANGRQPSGTQQPMPKEAAQSSVSSLRNRRQSSITQTAASAGPVPAPPTTKHPRKSVGPGLFTSMGRGASGQQQGSNTTTTTQESPLKSALSRTNSLNKARRTTIQPSASAGAELPRMSTFTATTQSRQNKVKSLQPPPHDSTTDNPNTPTGGKSSKANQNRSQTPSSSGGGRRQSMASGRASGLGARTISPTDARRLKRMSMAPPMPGSMPKSHTPTPQEEIPNPLHSEAKLPDLPRFAQPSPSLIPRKTNSATPSSGGSPEGRQYPNGGVSLSSKSSYQSLLNNSLNGSSSRLPTPKPRGGNQPSSAMGQYGDNYEEGERSELVPPVPAIPKAFESPKDFDQAPFFSSSLRSSQTGNSDAAMDSQALPAPRFLPTPRTSFDVPAETPRKRSGEMARPQKHISTQPNGATSAVPPPSAPPVSARAQPDPNGRKNANLQPLRLPPLNMHSFGTRPLHSASNAPRPSHEVDSRDDWMNFATPEPKRNTKTPSTPMTASKATFFSRRQQEDANKGLRSSSSHYALRDVMGMDDNGNITKFWDDSDADNAGVPIPNAKQRSAITPFASGSLPKVSGEYARNGLRGRPSGEHAPSADEEYENMLLQNSKPRTRAQTNATMNSMKSGLSADTSAMSMDYVESPTDSVKKEAEKKEGTGGGLRRKLSLGWKRSNSKAANHADYKNSPQQEQTPTEKPEKSRSRLQKRSTSGSGGVNANEMPPPKLPASATWTGEVPSLPSSQRPSMDTNEGGGRFHIRRKSQVPTSVSNANLTNGNEQNQPPQQQAPPHGAPTGLTVKTRSQHSEQPTPVTSRASSWGNLGQTLRPGAKPAGPVGNRHKPSASNLSVLNKDKDDLAADDEMQRLSRKRKDVDSAARESEELKKRAIARSPVTAERVLHDRSLLGGAALNVFERGEIVDYEADGIYFTGSKSARKIIGSLGGSGMASLTSLTSDGKSSSAAGSGNNFGYDDERGDYNIVMGDHLAYRYEVVDVLGKGSFGQVVRCVDHKEGGVVAVKIIRNKKRFHQQALVEVGILGRLREWDPDGSNATLSITTSFYFRSHLCIVTPCLSINLYELIRSHNFAGFSLPLIRRFSRQLLACLTLLHTKRIIHCDLKPENILLCEARKADVRVIDFGSSCREEEKVYTYIQSRFYRSPEVILGSQYGLGIDMWSLGCILAELWTGYPIFPGENEQEQLACIMEIFGPPDRHLVERCTRKKLFFDSVGKPRVTVSSKGRRRRPSSKTLAQALKTEDEAFTDFIGRCLRWDPERRLKPHEAMNHPFVTNAPFHHARQGIPEEARRAARLRSQAAVPAAGAATQAAQSPVKGRGAASAGFTATTPARTRALPETPQTAVRTGGQGVAAMQGSPSKGAGGGPVGKRHSTIAGPGGPASSTNANAAAMAGSKRASNGAVLGGGALLGGTQGQGQRGASGLPPPPPSAPAQVQGSLAQMAAVQSMGNAGVGGGGRWRG
ncbi:serine/threonine protein kinase, CMGC, dual-specificity [Saxophila tyrrhenica]|uniref:Serine/threonine protein kinase, CMGC, dual-specificity n=1 Tax=Saxophila tyrrhenica TaxID=1690608 RepID=A0AAV9PDX6_9PEZI|nr:serine/threonine protein kinase, CMGC, dual-specificity [Saxophila tyrrhenica]